jgi:2-polyprenyl-3-methyl-5-hydroxy-6-metoxy-1,4-benzoquinol methylase
MTTAQPPSPELFMQTLWAYQRTAAIRTAVELDVFSAIDAGADTPEAIARHCAASERGTRILCDYLAMLGFLVKSNGCYALTPDSATFLVKRSPAYMGGVTEFLMSDAIVRNLDKLADTVRRGTVLPNANIVSEENPVWEAFARAMVPMMGPAGQEMAGLLADEKGGRQRVLDIAAGHGLFGIAIAQRNPQAEVVAVDWPRVVAVASENASRLGVDARHQTIAGDAFSTDWGHGYDLALVTNFLHHFDVPTCTSLLRKVRASLGAGGRVAVLEFVPNEDRLGPALPAAFALTMLAETAGGDAYTFAELTAMLEDAGFRDVSRHDLHGPETVVVAHA